MSLSEAVRIFFSQAVAEQRMAFAAFRSQIPNKTTLDSFVEMKNGGGSSCHTPIEVLKNLEFDERKILSSASLEKGYQTGKTKY